MRGYPSIHLWFNAIWGEKAQKVSLHELPRCTPRILYAQAWPAHPERAVGLFSFSQEHVLVWVREHLEWNRYGNDNHPFDQSILEYLQNVGWLSHDPARLPHGWVGIENILLPLIQENDFEIKCLGCQRDYRPQSLICVPETHKFGSFSPHS